VIRRGKIDAKCSYFGAVIGSEDNENGASVVENLLIPGGMINVIRYDNGVEIGSFLKTF
jgi:hypothetical protein